MEQIKFSVCLKKIKSDDFSYHRYCEMPGNVGLIMCVGFREPALFVYLELHISPEGGSNSTLSRRGRDL